jgi:hypothetical protein
MHNWLIRNPGDPLTSRGLPPGMGRAERRAKDREEEKRGRAAQRSARKPGPETFRSMAEERPETQNETARRIYRAGGEPERPRKIKRRAGDKPQKWREGHQ